MVRTIIMTRICCVRVWFMGRHIYSRGNFPNTAHLGNTAHLAISVPGDRREILDTWETHSLILGIL